DSRLRWEALCSSLYAAMQRTSAPNIGEAPLPQRARSFWKTRISALHGELERFLEEERAQLPPWFVVGFGAGIAAWFVIGTPLGWQAFLCSSLAVSFLGLALAHGRSGRALAWFALAAALGCTLVWVRSAGVASPRLDRPQVVQLSAEVEDV